MPGIFLNAPDVYMDKIAVGGGLPDDLVDLDEAPAVNLKNLARAKKSEVADLVVCILDRPRHAELIAKVREAGARIVLISDGDVSGVIATSSPETGIDMYVGSGGAPEGRAGGGGAALHRRPDAGPAVVPQRRRAHPRPAHRHHRPRPQIQAPRPGAGDVMFAATGVTNGTMLKGVRRFAGGAFTHSVVMRSKTGTVRYIEASHDFTRKGSLAPLAR